MSNDFSDVKVGDKLWVRVNGFEGWRQVTEIKDWSDWPISIVCSDPLRRYNFTTDGGGEAVLDSRHKKGNRPSG